jgi:hypothetical protein
LFKGVSIPTRLTHGAGAERSNDLLRNKKIGIDENGRLYKLCFFEFLLWITMEQRALRP